MIEGYKKLYYLRTKENTYQFFDFFHRILENGNNCHFHGENVYEFHFVVNGKAKLIIGNKEEMVIEKNDFFIVGPFVNHEQLKYENYSCEKMSFCIRLDDHALETDFKRFKNMKFHMYKNVENAGKTFMNILNILKEGTDCEKRISDIISRLLILVKDDSKEKVGRNVITGYIMENLSVSPKNVADRLQVSVRTLERICQRNFNTTFIKLRNEIRVYHASDLLEYSTLPISGICDACGFNDIDYFTAEFKKVFGLSPKKYKKSFDKTVIR